MNIPMNIPASLSYRLVVVTHDERHLPTLKITLASFAEMVEPKPVEWVIVYDGPEFPASHRGLLSAGVDDANFASQGTQVATGGRLGFCGAATVGWSYARSPIPTLPNYKRPDFVFWLEHDFRFLRPVNLEELATVLIDNPLLAQMSLMRGPVNDEERAAGGLVAANPSSFRGRGSGEMAWLAQQQYWTTNPSLFWRDLPMQQPWPDGPHCEGKFTHQLLREIEGVEFGVWGDGAAWIEHIGERTGHGY